MGFSPQPNLITRRTGRLLLVWTLTIDLSGMGGPTRRTKSPASIALRFTETHKPVHHDKVAISTQQVVMIDGFFLLQILQELQSEDTSVKAPWTDREIRSASVEYIALFCDLGEDCEWLEKP